MVVVPALCVSLVRAALGVGAFGPTPDRMLLLTILITGTSPTAMNISTIAGLVGRWQVGAAAPLRGLAPLIAPHQRRPTDGACRVAQAETSLLMLWEYTSAVITVSAFAATSLALVQSYGEAV